MNLESQLNVWYVGHAFSNPLFGGRKPKKNWSWPTISEVCEGMGIDEEELRDSIGDNEEIVIRNGKVGLVHHPSVSQVFGSNLHNPNSGF